MASSTPRAKTCRSAKREYRLSRGVTGNRGLKTDGRNSNSDLHRGMESGTPPVKAISGIVHLVGNVRDPKSWTLEATSSFSSGMRQPGGTNLFLSALSGAIDTVAGSTSPVRRVRTRASGGVPPLQAEVPNIVSPDCGSNAPSRSLSPGLSSSQKAELNHGPNHERR
jgi:hypothetical protein